VDEMYLKLMEWDQNVIKQWQRFYSMNRKDEPGI